MVGLGLRAGLQAWPELGAARAGGAAELPRPSEPHQLLCFGLLGRREQQQRAEELFQQVGLGSGLCWVCAALLTCALHAGHRVAAGRDGWELPAPSVHVALSGYSWKDGCESLALSWPWGLKAEVPCV